MTNILLGIICGALIGISILISFSLGNIENRLKEIENNTKQLNNKLSQSELTKNNKQ